LEVEAAAFRSVEFVLLGFTRDGASGETCAMNHASGLSNGENLAALLQDLRYALRLLARSPGFAAVAVLTLALGIGANTGIFTVADALLLRPLPYANPQQLMMVYETSITNRSEESVFSYPYFARLRDQQHSFSGISAFASDDFDMTGRGEPRQISAGRVSWNFFDVLGVQPALGRDFFASEGQRGSNRVLMLSHQFWISEFGGARNVVGQSLMLNSLSYTIVGVLPANFSFTPLGSDTQIWIPREFELNIATPEHIQAGMGYLEGVARLAPGVSIEQAQSEMDVLHKEYCRDNPTRPDANPKWPSAVTPLQTMIVANIRAAVLILMGVVGVVLLIACANVASLLLSRALKRKKEIAVRTALGASRGVIVRQLLVESLLLAAIGGVIGIFAGYAGTRGLLALNQDTVSQLSGGVAMDWRVLCFTIAISLVSGVLFGLAPALQLSKTDLNSVLRDEGRGSTGSRHVASSQNVLVVAQVALSMILLIGSGLLIRSFLQLMNVNPGFDPRNVLTMRINLPPSKYGTNAQMVSFTTRCCGKCSHCRACAPRRFRRRCRRLPPGLRRSSPRVNRSCRCRNGRALISRRSVRTMRRCCACRWSAGVSSPLRTIKPRLR